ncbi:hypothetical protein GCM10027284_09550 [Cyclobacterium sediminis]
MKKGILHFVLFCLTFTAYSQNIINIKPFYYVSHSISKDKATSFKKEENNLQIEFDEEIIKFRSHPNLAYEILETSKITKSYIIGENLEGHFVFLDRLNNQLYFIFDSSRDEDYTFILALGEGRNVMIENANNMMKKIKNNQSYRDCILYLINQQKKYGF